MKASIVDSRYETNDILKVLDENESVTVLYHGKVKGIIKPADVGSRMITWIFFEKGGFLSVPIFEYLEGRFVV